MESALRTMISLSFIVGVLGLLKPSLAMFWVDDRRKANRLKSSLIWFGLWFAGSSVTNSIYRNSSPEKQAERQSVSAPAYELTAYKQSMGKTTVDIQLSDRIDSAQMKALADVVHGKYNTDIIMARYYIGSNRDVAAWATSAYSDGKSDYNINGFTKQDFETAKKVANRIPVYGNLIGRWYADNIKRVIYIIYIEGDKYYLQKVYHDASISDPSPIKRWVAGGKVRFSEDALNYYELSKDGELNCFNTSGEKCTGVYTKLQ